MPEGRRIGNRALCVLCLSFTRVSLRADNGCMDTDFSRAWMTLKSLTRIPSRERTFWFGASVVIAGIAYWLVR